MKILVVSNNCFAKNNSNGRILGCLFNSIPLEDVSQFYIVDGSNDFSVCNNYYLVNDSMAIRSLIRKDVIGECKSKKDGEARKLEKMSKHRAKYGRSSLTMLIRNFIWSRFKWWNADFERWLKDTKADVLVFQAGDAPFMYEIAYRISQFLNIPIVIFNTEFYYFEEDNFINDKDPKFLFRLYKRILCRKVKKVFKYSSLTIHNSEWMKNYYDREFNTKNVVIHQSSESKPVDYHENVHSSPRVVYVGSLGFRRYEPLSEIAEAINSINENWHLSVYGMIKDVEAQILFDKTPGLDYKGVIPYEEALRVISESDLLILTENLDPEFSKSTSYGFSTKITDYLFSGIPILAYGPINNVGMNYLHEHNAAVVVNDQKDLETNLRRILTDNDYRKTIVKNALSIAINNHDAIRNSNIFKQLLQEVCPVNN
ncbi:MAG: hypothetical protein J5524_05185 [Bacteroidaceae bacterium]|nr:hypothetical protein [Bacteroidaceae bacterium]